MWFFLCVFVLHDSIFCLRYRLISLKCKTFNSQKSNQLYLYGAISLESYLRAVYMSSRSRRRSYKPFFFFPNWEPSPRWQWQEETAF